MSPESESVVLTLVMPVDVEDALLETLLDISAAEAGALRVAAASEPAINNETTTR